MKKRISTGALILLCLLIILVSKGIRYTIMKKNLVDEGVGWSFVKMMNDGNKPRFGLTIKGSKNEDSSDAEGNAVAILKTINFLKLTSYQGLEIYITVIWNIITFYIMAKHKHSYSMIESIFILMSIAVLNIFNFCLAKEPIQMLYFFIMYAVIKSKMTSKQKFIGCFLVFMLCFMTFRNYYILMAVFMIFIYYIINMFSKKMKKTSVIIIILSIYVCIFALMNTTKIVSPKDYAELIRVRTRTSSANSDIRVLFNSSNLLIYSLDYILVLIRILIPAELLTLGPKYFIYAVYQIMVTILLINNLKNINTINANSKLALYIVIAFTMGSALFEPDFGSWVRHEAVIFPIYLFMLDAYKNKKEGEKSVEIYN